MRSKVSSIVAVALLAMLTLSISANDASAQARPSSKGSILSIEPFGLLGIGAYKYIQLQYEWRLTQDNSIALRAALLPAYAGVSGFGVGGSYRFYVADGRALTGLNVSPGIDLVLLSAGNASYQTIGIGGDLAYKWIFDSFGVEPYFRLRQNFAGSEGYYAGLDYGVGVYLGYAW
jgi:hypothetical protein